MSLWRKPKCWISSLWFPLNFKTLSPKRSLSFLGQDRHRKGHQQPSHSSRLPRRRDHRKTLQRTGADELPRKHREKIELSPLKSTPLKSSDLFQVKTVMTISGSNTANEEDKSLICPVCLSVPEEQIFNCVHCDNLICGSCRKKVSACPSCRKKFNSDNPRRNRTAERLIASMK